MRYPQNGDDYDVIVVGAGPAGSMAAKAAASRGVNVLLIERDLEIGVPDKCGEFLPSLQEMKRLCSDALDLSPLFDPPNHCIMNHTKYVRFIFPNKTEFTIPFYGVVIDRKIFDKHLSYEAARAGAEILPFTTAIKLLDNGVQVRRGREVIDLYSRVVIGADGAYSLIAREAGLPISRDPMDYGVGYQYEMVGVEHDPDYVDMYIGEDVAPGTYAWIIPKAEDVANVGTGARTPFMERGMSIRAYQRNFIEKHPIASEKLRKASPTAVKAGYIPVGGPMKRTSTDKVIAVGDAGGHTIPTVGGGVPPGLIVGRIAGESAAAHVQEGKPLTDFDNAWRQQMGRVLDNSLRLRKMSDVVFRNKAIIEVVTRLDWLTRDTISKFVYCQIDEKMRLIELALQSGRLQRFTK